MKLNFMNISDNLWTKVQLKILGKLNNEGLHRIYCGKQNELWNRLEIVSHIADTVLVDTVLIKRD